MSVFGHEPMEVMPDTIPAPCSDCPWRREAIKGWLGPQTAEEWIETAHSEALIACHQTINGDVQWDDPALRQCRGAAIFRANVGKKPRDPRNEAGPEDKERCFATNVEFIEHHDRSEHRTRPTGFIEEGEL